MRKKIVTVLVGGLLAAGVTVTTVQIAESAPPAAGSDPAAAHRKNVTVGRGGIVAPAAPRSLGEQLTADPDPLATSTEGVKAGKNK